MKNYKTNRTAKASKHGLQGFTLIELLVVITIIGVLAGFTIPVIGAVKVRQYESHATAELKQLEAAIENYKAAYGFYPPSNPGNPVTNQLYYELVGTTNILSSPLRFQTLDGSETLDSTLLNSAFGPGVTAFVNCSKPGAVEDTSQARNFIYELKPGQTTTFNGVTLFVTSVGGPSDTYKPLGVAAKNPWRYVYPGTQNPNGYDLWVQLKIGNKTYLISNWSTRPQINSPLP